MEPRSILVVSDVWKWFAEAEHLALACEALAARGHRIDLASQPESPLRARLAKVVRTFHDLPGLRRPRSPLAPLGNLRRLRALLRAGAYDLVHAYRSPPHLLAALALRGLGARRPALIRTRGGAQRVRASVANRRLYAHLTDALCVTSRTIADDLSRLGVAGEAVTLLPSVVDPGRLEGASGAAFRRAHGLPEGAPLVGLMGRTARIKGGLVLVEALPRLLAARPELHVALVGPRPDSVDPCVEAEALALAERLGVASHLHLTGPTGDPGSALRAFDVVTVPSLGSEVIARVPLEAMALGRPVVASSVGVLPEVVRDGTSGWIVPPGDPEALARAILHALSGEGARRGAAAAAQVRAEHLPGHLATALEAVYARVLSA